MITPVQEKTAPAGVENSDEFKKTPVLDKPNPRDELDKDRAGKKNAQSTQLK
jgi:hypothetical protein